MNAHCRFCNAPLLTTFVDLGASPLANSLLDEAGCSSVEARYPLHAMVCEQCFLVQLNTSVSPEIIFKDYLYFSSYSDSWLVHCHDYCAAMTERFSLGRSSMVVEIASNDGGLLRNFVEAGIPVLGVEPAANVAAVANGNGVPTRAIFFGEKTAMALRGEGFAADLVAANNVLAHVPDINDFVAGFRILLKPQGVATFEFPHLLTLIQHCEFDTIYHEHFSYISLLAAEKIMAAHGLSVFDVEELPTHGGSLRLFVAHQGVQQVGERVVALRAKEMAAGLDRVASYAAFAGQAVRIKRGVRGFFEEAKQAGKRVAGYGAPAKGNTLLNYCGIGPDLMAFTVDRSPHKQGRFLPGTRIPIHAPEKIFEAKPDYIFILPWNIKDEIVAQMGAVREFGGKFVTAIPGLKIW